ncbi:MAG: hypothetical protein RML93_13785 [Anaerolineales bacterium]|nr:hypothetical protein [Anaerolineales bacterium]MCS7247792.1 hypothetical protein [Anaerolineales bacterium]MDW8161602.1 hypothetical protein [Anaerolineales bacterium]MDW8448345.1 hypothetical protein [Anaerolineales bacterium]
MRPSHQSLLLSLLVFLFLAACADSSERETQPKGTYPLHPSLRSFYEQLGGRARLGPAISPPLERGEKIYQYTTAVLLEYDRQTGQAQLAPLGYELGVRARPELNGGPIPPAQVERVKIFPLFAKVYAEMGGESVVGFPLSEARYNERLGRYEQYFERAGFYLLEEDPSQTVYLLAYGAWKCRQSCPYPVAEDSRIDLPSLRVEPIVAFVSRHGVEFTGFALSEPYLTEDKLVEQIFENLVIVFNPEHPEQVGLRPLPQLLGIPADPLEPPQTLPEYIWVSVEREQGFLVPKRFWEYLQAHGGLELSGPPQTRAHELSAGRQRQCFIKFCVEDQVDLYGIPVVRLSRLGEEYRKRKFKESGGAEKTWERPQITLRTWETQPLLASGQTQIIGVGVYSGAQPLSSVVPELILSYPDGKEERITLPPTDSQGKTQIALPPVEAENGTLISYRVCVQDRQNRRFCVRDSFLIWQEGMAIRNLLHLPVIYRGADRAYQVFLPFISR